MMIVVKREQVGIGVYFSMFYMLFELYNMKNSITLSDFAKRKADSIFNAKSNNIPSTKLHNQPVKNTWPKL